jgi:hypothetical protein
MKHLSDALNALNEDCAWFARARELRLLVVRTSGDIRKTAIRLLPGYECHADNRSPWILLEDPYQADHASWDSRAARLLADWQRRREAFEREHQQLPAAVVRPALEVSALAERPGLDRFFVACVAVLDALRPPLDGLVLVVAPAIVGAPDAFDVDLCSLFARPELRACRIVLVLDVDVALPARVIEALAAQSLVCHCGTDPEQKRRDLHVLVDAEGGDASAAAGAAPAKTIPPRRCDAPPDLDPAVRAAALRQAGIEPAYVEHASALRRLILAAALAMGEGRSDEGIRLQSEAVALTRQVGMPQLMVICQITLASYLSAAGDDRSALEQLTVASDSAAAHGLREQESQAFLAQGLLYNLQQRPLDAATAYHRCASLAESASAGLLATEAWRLAGQAALAGGAIAPGVGYLQRALEVAGELDPLVRGHTSAPEIARGLAKLYAERGYAAHAQSLYAQADTIERGLEAGPEGAPAEPAQA